MNSNEVDQKIVWKDTPLFWVALAVTASLIAIIFYDGIARLVLRWSISEEYGYGFLIPVISGFLIWQKKDELETIDFGKTWAGLAIALIGIIVFFLGYFSTLFIVIQYGMVIVIYGVAYSIVGWSGIKKIWAPLLLLIFMIPLPNFLYQGLSAQLQLISSTLGVAVIRLFGISVFLEGNVIDLGSYKLQVVEACSGLRYLFPLVTLAFIATYFYKVAFWKRAVVFVSSLPITVLMNSFRIGVIGILVEYGGPEQAEGFLHDFEGWVVFMACMAVLIGEMWLLTRFGKEKKPLMEVFGLELPEPTPKDAEVRYRVLPKSFIAVGLFLLATAVAASILDRREEIIQDRLAFTEFPVTIGSWQGKRDRIEKIYLDVLKLDDYIVADYVNGNEERVNFYVAYYASQRSGESAHSPRSCIPGGGWKIEEVTQRNIDGLMSGEKPLMINRVVIKKGEHTQVVYYWFQQRGRSITSEYAVKWYLFWDALTRNRSDGALVRLVTILKPGENIVTADKRLIAFAKDAYPLLGEYVPD